MPEKPSATKATIAVLDIGKTNIKLSAVTPEACVLEVLSTPNEVLQGKPWGHHDLAKISEWVFTSLASLCTHHPITTIVTTGHGTTGVLVNDNPDELCALPQIDYEQNLPDDIVTGYMPLSGSFFDRGGNIMGQATHHARQLYWMERHAPEVVAKARWFLSVPQYWAWRLCGVAASERTALGAQSHFWNIIDNCWTPIVQQRGWATKIPPFRYAWERLGGVLPTLQRQYNLPSNLSVLTGGHDSSLNLYRYHAADMRDVRLISTGTWMVGMSAATPLSRIDPHRNMVINSDVNGNIVAGILVMSGREFSHIAHNVDEKARAQTEIIDRLIARGSYALPSFSDSDGLFPNSAHKGHYHGVAPQNADERIAMAVLYMALLSVECSDALGDKGAIVLDGTALNDPLYGILVAALRPTSETLCNYGSHGIAAGAALLATHATRHQGAPVDLTKPPPYAGDVLALRRYADEWKSRAYIVSAHKNRQG